VLLAEGCNFGVAGHQVEVATVRMFIASSVFANRTKMAAAWASR